MTLYKAFALFDADGDGKLTEDEVMAVLTRKTGRGTELSEEAARATWQRWVAKCDLNNDGKISVDELVEAAGAELVKSAAELVKSTAERVKSAAERV